MSIPLNIINKNKKKKAMKKLKKEFVKNIEIKYLERLKKRI